MNNRKRPSTLSWCCWAVSIALLPVVAGCYWFQPDWAAGITVYPLWAWVYVALLLVLPMLRTRAGKACLVSTAWLVVTVALADTPVSAVRSWRVHLFGDQVQFNERRLRVITLNAASEIAAVREAFRWQPDILLLQETPSKQALQQLAQEQWGEEANVLWDVDTSIVTRGSIEAIPGEADPQSTFVYGRVTLDGYEIDAVSLRLLASPVRLDFWSPKYWRTFSNNRRVRREQLRTIVKQVKATGRGGAILIGGDFNAPPRDAIFDVLKPTYGDAFVRAGRGWGATIVSDFPALRIDRIWHSDELRPVRAYAVTTQHSDHCLVFADFDLPPKPPRQ